MKVEIGPVEISTRRLIESVWSAFCAHDVPRGAVCERDAEMLEQAAKAIRDKLKESRDE